MEQKEIARLLLTASKRLASAGALMGYLGSARVVMAVALTGDDGKVAPEVERAVCAALAELWPDLYGARTSLAAVDAVGGGLTATDAQLVLGYALGLMTRPDFRVTTQFSAVAV